MKETVTKLVKESVISSKAVIVFFQHNDKKRKDFFSVLYDYVFGELLVFTVNGCFGRLIRLILSSHTDCYCDLKKHLVIENCMLRKKL